MPEGIAQIHVFHCKQGMQWLARRRAPPMSCTIKQGETVVISAVRFCALAARFLSSRVILTAWLIATPNQGKPIPLVVSSLSRALIACLNDIPCSP